jgi:ABC-type transport system involved in multi-copper enzyme maturation permease subunit
MSAAAITSARTAGVGRARPSFVGIVRGELFKIARSWVTWILAVLLCGAITMPYLATLAVQAQSLQLKEAPLFFLYRHSESGLAVLRVFGGAFMIILTARVFGIEYGFGTIRILLSRGVGRLQLLGAKLVAVGIVAAIMLAVGLLLNLVETYLLVLGKTGDLNAMSAVTSQFWSDMRLYTLTVIISMVVVSLMAMGITVLGRSLTIGLSVGMSWFLADNIGSELLFIVSRITHQDLWNNITAYLLGPNLNAMAPELLPQAFGQPALTVGARPNVAVDGTHTLVVTLVYGVIFLGTTIVLLWRRDVTE